MPKSTNLQMRKQFGKTVKKRRLALGLSRAELVRRMQISPFEHCQMLQSYGKTLHFFRESVGISQAELAEKANAEIEFIAAIEDFVDLTPETAASKDVRVEHILALCDVLEVTLKQFLTRAKSVRVEQRARS